MGSEALTAQPTEANVNTTIAPMNTRRTPNLSANQPLAGISTATVTRYAEIATLTSTASTPNEEAISGMAGAMIVASRISMNSAPATNSAIPLGNGEFTVRLPRR
ncbi:uncharacterized protein RMCFA_2203 [Mycolicibacterium fortuitum subsp. acetamidolyticum]|uniref:Uncharacterized protein n=1 Tax=Mycolicibacterium fortuitum subsp. acetamidolyticum TaxID=144550 RepID=A0A117IE43_MYCFO|nr:uncharacterized protein RMCFA_2203 [Mycolicibacterium fortuitum subsp. acetamidolyticum]